MFTYLKIAVRNIIKQKKRTLFLTAALSLGTGVIILANSFANGISENVIRTGTALHSGHVNVVGHWKNKNKVFERISDKQKIRKLINNKVTGIEFIVERLYARGFVFNPDRELGSVFSFAYGIDLKKEKLLKKSLHIVSGSMNNFSDNKKCLVFDKTAEKLKVKVGDTITLNTTVHTKEFGNATSTLDLQIVCIAKDMGGRSKIHSIYTTSATMREYFNYDINTTSRFLIYLKDIKYAKKVSVDLKKSLSKHWALFKRNKSDLRIPFFTQTDDIAWKKGLRIEVSNFREELYNLMIIKDVLDWLTYILIFILSAIVFAGISNSLWMTIRERTSEIGTLRAIGMARHSILVMFLCEGFMLGVAAGVLGIGVGSGLSWLLDSIGITSDSEMMKIFLYNGRFTFSVYSADLVSVLGYTLLLVTGGSFFPALHGARMQPINAINHIG